MKKTRNRRHGKDASAALSRGRILAGLFLALAVVMGTTGSIAATTVDTAFLYNLSNFSGPVPFNWARVRVDRKRAEVYVTDSRRNEVRVFNEQGMEVYRFGDDGGLGSIKDTVVTEGGDVLVLTRESGNRTRVLLCNYRGERVSELPLRGLPPGFPPFSPGTMFHRQGRLYLVDGSALRVVVTDDKGLFLRDYDLGALVKVGEKKKGSVALEGFSVDGEGNMLFTIPVLFAAFRLSEAGVLSSFGVPGSGPGRFGVVGGIVADEAGNLYVADRLKSVVMVFDRDFAFLREFGYQGTGPDNLIGPNDLALDGRSRLYVSQVANRGISVFRIAGKGNGRF